MCQQSPDDFCQGTADHSGRLVCPAIPAATHLSTRAMSLVTLNGMKGSSRHLNSTYPSTLTPESTNGRSKMSEVALRIAAVLVFLLGAAVLVFGRDVADHTAPARTHGHKRYLPSPSTGRRPAGDSSNGLGASAHTLGRGIILCPVKVGVSGANRNCRLRAA